MLLLQSCGTTKVETVREIPDFDFPEFPDVYGDFVDGDKVLIDLNTFVNLAKFKVSYEGLNEYYLKLKELENEQENVHIGK